jgi:hypothetical protein
VSSLVEFDYAVESAVAKMGRFEVETGGLLLDKVKTGWQA